MVSFALALTSELQKQLLLRSDPCDISEFLQSLKNLGEFNIHINMKMLMQKARSIELIGNDFTSVTDCGGGFYGKYYKAYAQELFKSPLLRKDGIEQDQNATSSLISHWYKQISKDREVFIKFNQAKQAQAEIESNQLKAVDLEIAESKRKVKKEISGAYSTFSLRTDNSSNQ